VPRLLPSIRSVTLLLALAQVAGAPSPVHQDEIRVIAVLPTGLPQDAPDSAAVRARFDSILASQLTRAGYNVLAPDRAQAVWQRLSDSAHGFFDARTGQVNRDKLYAVRAAAWRELHEGAQADLLLFPRIVVVFVEFNGGKATWDGMTEKVASSSHSGTVPAASFMMYGTDSSGQTSYCGRGGIQLLAKGGFWSDKIKEVDPKKLFAQLERDSAAIHRALRPLVEHRPVCSSS